MRAVPPLRDEILFERELPPGQRVGVLERLDALDALRAGHAKLEDAVLCLSRFVSQELAATLKPPEHESSAVESLSGVSVRAGKFLSAFRMRQVVTGKTVLITGATSGIGLEASVALARMGATVVIVARHSGKGARALADVKARSGSGRVSLLLCDLSSLASVRALAASFRASHDRLDVLVNNAGAISHERQTTVDGFELTFAVNHLAPFLLTSLLLDLLERSAPARVVNVASAAHGSAGIDFENLQFEHGGYSLLKAYNRSKLANVLFTNELSRRLAGTGVTANSLHPGVVATNIWNNIPWFLQPLILPLRLFMITAERGGETIVHLAASAEVDGKSGGYYVKNRRVEPAPLALDQSAARRLWNESARLVGV